MSKVIIKLNGSYKGFVSSEDIVYTNKELLKIKTELGKLETSLLAKTHVRNSEFTYELGLYLKDILIEHGYEMIDRFLFWASLRENVNANDKRIVRSMKRDFYEYAYQLSKLPKELVIKYSYSKWSYFYDVTLVREDSRIFDFLLKCEDPDFVHNNDIFQTFLKVLKVYLKKIDVFYLSDNEYEVILEKNVLIAKEIYIMEKELGKKMGTQERDMKILGLLKTQNVL